MTRKKSRPAAPKADTLEQANALIQSLWDRLNDIEDRLKQSSRNSSRPPSSDGPAAVDRPRKSSGKPRGAQPGHKGSNRARVDEVDVTLSYYPPGECACGGKVVSNATPYYRHQVFDIPQQAYNVTEHQLYQGSCCRCGEAVQATLPETVNNGQMGANMLAFIAIQAGQFHQSISQIQQQLQQNFGVYFSRGAISEAHGKVSAMLTPVHQQIKQLVQDSTVIHADETRHKRENENRWMWLACTDELSCFMIHYSRAQHAARALLGDVTEAVIVTDQYAGYHYLPPSQRQFCWAHILRNVGAIADSWGPNKPIGQRLETLIHLIFRTRHRFERGELSPYLYQKRMGKLRKRWQATLEHATRACVTPRYRNRCGLLLKHDESCWTFLTDKDIPLTNNEAERSLRSYVLWRKGSYGVYSHRGEQFRQRILTIVESCRKLGANPLDWLRQIVHAVITRSEYPALPELTALSQ